MNYHTRVMILAGIDSLIIFISIFIGNWILYPKIDLLGLPMIISAFTLLVGHHIFARIYRLYARVWEYASVQELISILRAVSLNVLLTGLVEYLLFSLVYKRLLLVTWMIHILLIGGSRFAWRLFRDTKLSPKIQKSRTLIVGAGAAGSMTAKQMLQSHESELVPVAFLDDDINKQKLMLHGIPVVGQINQIENVVREYKIEHIIVAIPSLNKKELAKIIQLCTSTGVKTQTIPKIEDIMTGKVSISNFKNVDVEDLLGRDPVQLNVDNISQYVTGKTILVTGAGGSIGSEICRQISHFRPNNVVLLGHGENSIYEIHRELTSNFGKEIDYIPVIADVQDFNRMMEVIGKYKPEVIFHAAAHKHVPLMELNPVEAIKNNIIGTKNVAEAADFYDVHIFVLISTDKAVNPTSVMGASKRIAEMIIQNMAKTSNTKFVAVRFGNVLGSRGSVVPLFKEQIRKGGPVTVTHPEMTRYFMTIPEATRLVIQAGALARGGEIFVLDMGEPVKIVDLARNLIRLSGYTEDEIKIEFTGIRPGEKLYEELLNENEVHSEKVFENIYIGKSVEVDMDEINNLLNEFTKMNVDELRRFVIEIANNKKETLEIL